MTARITTGFILFVAPLLAQQATSSSKPEYFDQPTFIVAGVTDASARGGHGSDPVLRSIVALTRAMASFGGAHLVSGNEQALRESIERDPDNAQLRHSLAEVEEEIGNPLEAVREYQRAAELLPNESNLFDWGSELLAHRASRRAADIFLRGAKLFPQSARMRLGLAICDYSQGSFDEARNYFFEAADVNPRDPTPYLVMGKAVNGGIPQSAGFAERMGRFAALHPDNAWANYYCAIALRSQPGSPDEANAQTLLENAVRIDPNLDAAWLELGIVYSNRSEAQKAINGWERAAAANPHSAEPHYRLAQAYRRTGEQEKAKQEIALYEQISKQSAEEFERERAGIKEFVFSMREPQR